MFKIFSGANGLYVAWEREDGFHYQPSDNGAGIGWNTKRAEKILREKILRESERQIQGDQEP